MDYEIYPLAITQVEWSVFVDVCKRILGISPTRGLDACGLDIKDPAAYLGCLNLDNDPLAAFRCRDPAFRHFNISFIAVLDEESLLLLNSTDLTVTSKKGRRDFVVILSANMDTWYRTIRYACRPERDYAIRAVMCIILALLQSAGFRHIFSDLSKTPLQDGTFTLK